MSQFAIFLIAMAAWLTLLAAYAWQYFKCEALVSAGRIAAPTPDTFFRTPEGSRFLMFVLARGYVDSGDKQVVQAFHRLRQLLITLLAFAGIYFIMFIVLSMTGS